LRVLGVIKKVLSVGNETGFGVTDINRFHQRLCAKMHSEACPAIEDWLLGHALFNNPAFKVSLRSVLDTLDKNNCAPIHYAVFSKDIEKVNLILDLGGHPGLPGPGDRTPIHLAAKYGFHEILRFISFHLPDLEALDEQGYTPLHLAAKFGQRHTASQLVQLGVDIHSKGHHQETALDLATGAYHYVLAEFLVRNGADPYLNGRDGFRAIFNVPLEVKLKFEAAVITAKRASKPITSGNKRYRSCSFFFSDIK
jgi:ankyrin repeat protein